MSRDIKFRAWDIQDKRLIIDTQDFIPLKITSIGVLKLDPSNKQDKWLLIDRDRFILSQYIGLKDRNGIEIYEGDIVKIPNDWDKYGMTAGEIYEIYFAYGGFRLKPKYNKKGKGHWLDDGNDVTIIGNIYKNPELLKNE